MKTEEIINKHRKSDKDTGSSAVQISILTESISQLQKHLQTYKKDLHSRVGLMHKISKRRKLMRVMKDKEPQKYQELIQDLGIRG